MSQPTAPATRLAFALTRAMDGTIGKRNPPPVVLDDARQAALDAVKAIAGPDGRAVAKSYDEVNAALPADLRAWLLELPSFLAKKGRRGEGEELCGLLEPLWGKSYLDAERAVLEWEAAAGDKEKRAAARQQLDGVRAAHESHCWPELRTAYVLEQEGLLDRAQKHYEAAVEKARTSELKKDLRFCWDGLVQFWHNKGDRAKAIDLSRQMLKECPELEEELRVETIHNDAPRPGRNDPCSCGSGKKWKKCCGANG